MEYPFNNSVYFVLPTIYGGYMLTGIRQNIIRGAWRFEDDKYLQIEK
jgi:hypothetical protein